MSRSAPRNGSFLPQNYYSFSPIVCSKMLWPNNIQLHANIFSLIRPILHPVTVRRSLKSFGTFAYRLSSACRSEAAAVPWCDGVTMASFTSRLIQSIHSSGANRPVNGADRPGADRPWGGSTVNRPRTYLICFYCTDYRIWQKCKVSSVNQFQIKLNIYRTEFVDNRCFFSRRGKLFNGISI